MMNQFCKKSIREQKKGFTLIELVVSVGIFSMVSVIAVGALYYAQAINTKMQETHIMLDGINLSMELMVRDFRYGVQFHCDTLGSVDVPTDPTDFRGITTAGFNLRKSCPLSSPSANDIIIFGQPGASASDYNRVAYFVSNGHIMRWEGTNTEGTTTTITSDDVNIQMLHFYVSGAEHVTDATQNVSGSVETNGENPLVTVVVAGITKPAKINILPITFRLQSTVTSRVTDF